jgi:hypothetical protein
MRPKTEERKFYFGGAGVCGAPPGAGGGVVGAGVAGAL